MGGALKFAAEAETAVQTPTTRKLSPLSILCILNAPCRRDLRSLSGKVKQRLSIGYVRTARNQLPTEEEGEEVFAFLKRSFWKVKP